MQDTEVIIDDNYIKEMAEYFEKQGMRLQGMADAYISAITKMIEEGMPMGETSEALKVYRDYAQTLHQVIMDTSMKIRDSAMNCLGEIVTKDNYNY